MSARTLLDEVAASPATWPQMLRVEAALDRLATSYSSDAAKLDAAPLPDDPHAGEVYREVSHVLHGLARELRVARKP